MRNPEVIHFQRIRAEWGQFSNFFPSPIEVDGESWPTSEHWFQAQKFEDATYRGRIQQTKSPMIAARLGRSREQPIRPDWEAVRVDVMRRAVLAKFTQHAELRQLLLSTGQATIVEHTPRDSFWGDAGDGSGENWLGRVLMEVRDELRKPADAGRP